MLARRLFGAKPKIFGIGYTTPYGGVIRTTEEDEDDGWLRVAMDYGDGSSVISGHGLYTATDGEERLVWTPRYTRVGSSFPNGVVARHARPGPEGVENLLSPEAELAIASSSSTFQIPMRDYVVRQGTGGFEFMAFPGGTSTGTVTSSLAASTAFCSDGVSLVAPRMSYDSYNGLIEATSGSQYIQFTNIFYTGFRVRSSLSQTQNAGEVYVDKVLARNLVWDRDEFHYGGFGAMGTSTIARRVVVSLSSGSRFIAPDGSAYFTATWTSYIVTASSGVELDPTTVTSSRDYGSYRINAATEVVTVSGIVQIDGLRMTVAGVFSAQREVTPLTWHRVAGTSPVATDFIITRRSSWATSAYDNNLMVWTQPRNLALSAGPLTHDGQWVYMAGINSHLAFNDSDEYRVIYSRQLLLTALPREGVLLGGYIESTSGSTRYYRVVRSLDQGATWETHPDLVTEFVGSPISPSWSAVVWSPRLLRVECLAPV